eukprot:CAMPEP_0176374676 /NCGR_PEP_ID=MMETSP0126-20121128/26930_1 /TAXON_ID=141414 ORGANISM="Strombidinopsis acuminatum, Strain SPMC142" /NCGR_SAMPLE_ID=MMETSP0126 /ASSEMBLY_ACC=CAM_ASM_000229 /LENGTH=176 /DNA_ID=CAMNT_0017735359 /DNA_START=711 /DNA_END=1241 /DNA_ORIENTATION=-
MASSFSKLNSAVRVKPGDKDTSSLLDNESSNVGKKRSLKDRDVDEEQEQMMEARMRERNEMRNLARKENERNRRREVAGKNRTKDERDKDRDVSEKIALGQAQPTSKDAMYDQRLFNQTSGLEAGFGDDDDYNLYDKPLFADRTAASIYKNVNREALNDEDDGADNAGDEAKKVVS